MIKSMVTPGMGVNCYLVSSNKTNQGFLVDPGAGSKKILDWVQENKVEIKLIVLTHGHYDHIGSVEYLRKELKVQVAIHQDDAAMLTDPQKNLSKYMGLDIRLEPAEQLLIDHQELTVGEMKVTVLHTPGHTRGGISLLTEEGLLSGDTLFNGSIGRTDFPGGNTQQLLTSIQEKIMKLPDDLMVFPGHESYTTIGKERKTNPFINGAF